MNVTKETVTPKKAMEWLKRNVNNRNIRKGYSEMLAEAMNSGEWVLNGETIKFNCNGDLLDGQHRLNAVIISGKSIETYIVRGVQHDAFDTIDTGTRREVKDVFYRMGKPHYSHLATAIRIVSEIESGTTIGSGGARLRNIQAVEILKKNPQIEDSVQLMGTLDIRKLMSVGQAAALHYLMAKMDSDKAALFWTNVADGVGLVKTMPAYMFRDRLIENRAAKAKLRRFDLMGLAIKAWNHFRAGKSTRCLKVSENEAFPTIE